MNQDHGSTLEDGAVSEFGMHLRESGEAHVLEAVGDIDVESSRLLRAQILELFADPSSTVVLDLSRVGFMDSSGLGALVAGHKLADPHGSFRLAGANSVVRRVLQVTGLDRVFAHFDTVDEAVAG